MSDHSSLRIGFIGGGNMAQAIVSGLVQAGHTPSSIAVSDPAEAQRNAMTAIDAAIEVSADNTSIAETSEVLVLAVKPQIIAGVATAIAEHKRPPRQTVISVAAGITLQSLQKWFGEATAIVRVMPNQPALIGKGMSGLCATSNSDNAARAAADYLMAATGEIAWFEQEELIDAVTAISGSGPAYFYLIMEIMQEVAEEFGFDKATARRLSTQTALGAATVATEYAGELSTLRDQVTSPGGTTAAALQSLEDSGIRDILRRALIAARDRSIELGQPDAGN